MTTKIEDNKNKSKSAFRQVKLVVSKKERQWNRKKVRDQLYFIATHRQFLKKKLQQFCKTKKIKQSGTKEEIVKRIWEKGFGFEDIQEFVNQKGEDESKETMILTERIQLKKTKQLSYLCHLSKNLYNQGNYIIKTTLENESENGKRKWVRYLEIEKQLQDSPNYRGLPSQVAQQTLRLLDKNWKSFFKAMDDWRDHPEKYQQKPEPPRYKPKDGEHLVIFTRDECRIKLDKLRNKYFLHFNYRAKLPPVAVNGARIPPHALRHVRILPRQTYYILEVVYERELTPIKLNQNRKIGIDIGLRNIVTVVNNAGLQPWIVRGNAVMAINQYYNKLWGKFQSMNAKCGNKRITNRVSRLNQTRNNKILDLFHKLSRAIINYCLKNDFGTIAIGYNEAWKQKINLGRRTNQNFVNIPFLKLINQIQYKAVADGIEVVVIEESHTSKCSFLDDECIEHHENYLGKRGVYVSKELGGKGKVHHGLFQTATGLIINSDVNGAYNILKKAFPNAFADGIEGLGLTPCSVKFTELKQFVNLKSTQNALPKTVKVDGIEVVGLDQYARRTNPK